MAFTPQINEFRGRRTVQLNLIDLRRVEPTRLYDRFRAHEALRPDELRALAPDREDVIGVWNFLRRVAPGGAELRDNTDRLCLQIAASSPRPQAARRAIACLEILAELGLVSLRRSGSAIAVRIVPHRTNPLENSVLFCTLRKLKAGD